MKTWKVIPQVEIVSRYVECYWFLEKELGDCGNVFPKLNPDPSAHLIITNNSRLFTYVQDEIVQSVKGYHWIFPHLKTLNEDTHLKITKQGCRRVFFGYP